MARGNDRSKGRNIGHGSPLHASVAAETARHVAMFGTVVGTQDDGKYTQNRPTVGSYAHGETYNGLHPYPTGGAEGPGYSRPRYTGEDHVAVQVATMRDSYDKAMAGLMIPPSDNARQTEGLVDTGMGRLSDGVERPVHTYRDERIKNK